MIETKPGKPYIDLSLWMRGAWDYVQILHVLVKVTQDNHPMHAVAWQYCMLYIATVSIQVSLSIGTTGRTLLRKDARDIIPWSK